MQTHIDKNLLQTAKGKLADTILRSCVHCGFCNATCPTYQILGDELDGPRGRIYLIKQIMEGIPATRKTQTHLDRCLTCRNCESTCPSGVKYSQLLNIGRELCNQQAPRQLKEKTLHFVMRKFFLSKKLFSISITTAQLFRPILPASIKKSVPFRQKLSTQTLPSHAKKILLIEGCVQPALQPTTDIAARRAFDRLKIECVSITGGGCCGSLSHHLNAKDEAFSIIKKNIDAWLPLIETKKIEAITMTASGCGVAIKEYKYLLENDADYAEKAKQVSELYKDPIEIILHNIDSFSPQQLSNIFVNETTYKPDIAFHPPCTLQHGLQLKNVVEPLLTTLGYTIKPFKDNHLCCGSAGTYSITQKSLSQQLLKNKLNHIEKTSPDIIVTANIGCQLHLQSGTQTPVKHWLELLM